uniref:F-box/LRR-repeat protein 15/At3g58940/PEG3-like LRR domain-containing protein n=1 Tax=Leersia perrieri TaxID=77586 RepID=A0A0D9X6I2_9ORYZ
MHWSARAAATISSTASAPLSSTAAAATAGTSPAFAFDSCHPWDHVFVDVCLRHVIRHASRDELHLDLRFALRRDDFCQKQDGGCRKKRNYSESDDEDEFSGPRRGYRLPRRIFDSCVALRTLCVSYCYLNVPESESIHLPHVETMRLTGWSDTGRAIQRLISACPRLADLTLEDSRKIRNLSVLDKRPRRFALRCCPNVKSIAIDATELTTLAYSGAVLAESVISLRGGAPILSSCSVDICSPILSAEEIANLGRFLAMFTGTKHLHIKSARMGSSMESKHFAADTLLPAFTSLTSLQLTGRLPKIGVANAVRRILEQTPNLERLTLLLMPAVKVVNYGYSRYPREVDEDEKRQEQDEDESRFSAIGCLRHRVTTINLVQYNGEEEVQRMLVWLLLTNAHVLERLCVEMPVNIEGQLLAKHKNDIEGWMVRKLAQVTFT